MDFFRGVFRSDIDSDFDEGPNTTSNRSNAASSRNDRDLSDTGGSRKEVRNSERSSSEDEEEEEEGKWEIKRIVMGDGKTDQSGAKLKDGVLYASDSRNGSNATFHPTILESLETSLRSVPGRDINLMPCRDSCFKRGPNDHIRKAIYA